MKELKIATSASLVATIQLLIAGGVWIWATQIAPQPLTEAETELVPTNPAALAPGALTVTPETEQSVRLAVLCAVWPFSQAKPQASPPPESWAVMVPVPVGDGAL